jgi:mycoredoxin
MNDTNKKIIMYGTDWCSDTRRSKLYFRKQKVEYTYIDLDENPKYDDKVRKVNNGNRSVPTIFFPDGDVFIEPSNTELKEKFDALGISTR